MITCCIPTDIIESFEVICNLWDGSGDYGIILDCVSVFDSLSRRSNGINQSHEEY